MSEREREIEIEITGWEQCGAFCFDRRASACRMMCARPPTGSHQPDGRGRHNSASEEGTNVKRKLRKCLDRAVVYAACMRRAHLKFSPIRQIDLPSSRSMSRASPRTSTPLCCFPGRPAQWKQQWKQMRHGSASPRRALSLTPARAQRCVTLEKHKINETEYFFFSPG